MLKLEKQEIATQVHWMAILRGKKQKNPMTCVAINAPGEEGLAEGVAWVSSPSQQASQNCLTLNPGLYKTLIQIKTTFKKFKWY